MVTIQQMLPKSLQAWDPNIFPPMPTCCPNFNPAEFLIDENGVLVDILWARKSTEFMAMERIQQFLLSGEKEKYLQNRQK